jgi:hypothetical protein
MTNEQKHYYEKPDAVDESQLYEKPNTLEETNKFQGDDIVGNALYGLSVKEYDRQYSGLEVSDNNAPMSPQQDTVTTVDNELKNPSNDLLVDEQKPNTLEAITTIPKYLLSPQPLSPLPTYPLHQSQSQDASRPLIAQSCR